MKTGIERSFVVLTCLGMLAVLLARPPAARGGAPAGALEPPDEQELRAQVDDLLPQPSSGSDTERSAPFYTTQFNPAASSQASTTADGFGYTYDDQATYNWIDTSGGTEVEFADPDDSYEGPFAIGFAFPFYEHKYSELYIGTNGVLSFDTGAHAFTQEPIHHDTPPNNLIAPFWQDLAVNNGPDQYSVRLKLLGSAPNRTFVVSYEDVRLRIGSNPLTFQVVLYENGNLRFQYQHLETIQDPPVVGIEDDEGVTGLAYPAGGPALADQKAILIRRPDKGPNVKVFPTYAGQFLMRHKANFSLHVRNTGDAEDTLNFLPQNSNTDWKISFWNESSITPLKDTNQDGLVDSGLLAAGETKTVTVLVEAPRSTAVGDRAEIEIVVRSSQDAERQATARLQASLPAPFAQVYSDGPAGMRLSLMWAYSQFSPQVEDWFSGNNLSVLRTPGGDYVYAWEKNGSYYMGENQLVLYSDIEYTLLANNGLTLQLPIKLTRNENLGQFIFDRFPVMAALPGGQVAFAWTRDVLDIQNSLTNSNIYYAVVGANGNFVQGPTALTNNENWRGPGDPSIPFFFSPRLVANETQFAIAWMEQRLLSEGEISDLWLASFDAQGTIITAPSKVAASQAGATLYLDPSLVAISANRVLLAATLLTNENKTYNIVYQILDTAGHPIQNETPVGSASGRGIDTQTLAGGKVLLAWIDLAYNQAAYTLISEDTLQAIQPAARLANPNQRLAEGVSITADEAGRGILTWMDSRWNYYLYYALIEPGGNLVTEPMVFANGSGTSPQIITSFAGQGTAPYDGSWRLFLPSLTRDANP